MLEQLNPEEIEVEIQLVERCQATDRTESELDEMWSYVRNKSNPRWLWPAIHRSGKVLAYVFVRHKDEIFLQLKALNKSDSQSLAFLLMTGERLSAI